MLFPIRHEFLVIASDGAFDFQCADSYLCHSSCGVLVALPTRLQTTIHEWFHHLIYRSDFDFASVYVALQRSEEVDWTPCGTGERWFNYRFDSWSDHGVPTGVIETGRWEANAHVDTGYALPLREVSLVVLTECYVTFDEIEVLMPVDFDEIEDDLPPLNNVINHLVIHGDAGDDGDLWDIRLPEQ